MKKSASEPFDAHGDQPLFRYRTVSGRIERTLGSFESGRTVSLDLAEDLVDIAKEDPVKAWALARLRASTDYRSQNSDRTLRVVDLFSGCGGLAFGLGEAAHQMGYGIDYRLAADMDTSALEVYRSNIGPKYLFSGNVDSAVDYRLAFRGERVSFGYPPELEEPLFESLGEVDIVMGGPPCRGHSNLNNRTRRMDDRNSLYLTVPAIGVALNAKVVIIENVQAVLNSKPNVVAQARQVLAASGYITDEAVVEATSFGVAQTRKRHFLVAVRDIEETELKLGERLAGLASGVSASVRETLEDLEDLEPKSPFDKPADVSEENRRRIDYLFDNERFELPNEERPDCHKDGHTYPSVYGRLRPNMPAGTITGGFLSPGRGRFTHYSRRRGLTPHEGARIQGFPDFYRFEKADGAPLDNKSYSRLIGDAVPPPMSTAITISALIAAFGSSKSN